MSAGVGFTKQRNAPIIYQRNSGRYRRGRGYCEWSWFAYVAIPPPDTAARWRDWVERNPEKVRLHNNKPKPHKPAWIVQCAYCGGMFETNHAVTRYCAGCRQTYLRFRHYSRRQHLPINCADCGVEFLRRHVNQDRCPQCQYDKHVKRARRYGQAGGYAKGYKSVRSNAERWARKMQGRKAWYQQLTRDPVRYAGYLQWKRDWYKQRQQVLRELLSDPTRVEQLVLERIEQIGGSNEPE